jgi:hypothetical protein
MSETRGSPSCESRRRETASENYVATGDLTIAVNAAITLERPLLVKGEPGTGKTVLAEDEDPVRPYAGTAVLARPALEVRPGAGAPGRPGSCEIPTSATGSRAWRRTRI